MSATLQSEPGCSVQPLVSALSSACKLAAVTPQPSMYQTEQEAPVLVIRERNSIVHWRNKTTGGRTEEHFHKICDAEKLF